jgi:hypothetical protein
MLLPFEMRTAVLTAQGSLIGGTATVAKAWVTKSTVSKRELIDRACIRERTERRR